MKNKAIKIAESFLRPARSFGQTQRFIAESDIPKMVDQIYPHLLPAPGFEHLPNDVQKSGIATDHTVYSGGVSENERPDQGFLHCHPCREAILELSPDHVIVDRKDWEKARIQPRPTPEISEGEIESIINIYEDFKAKEKGYDGVEITAGNKAYVKLMVIKIRAVKKLAILS